MVKESGVKVGNVLKIKMHQKVKKKNSVNFFKIKKFISYIRMYMGRFNTIMFCNFKRKFRPIRKMQNRVFPKELLRDVQTYAYKSKYLI